MRRIFSIVRLRLCLVAMSCVAVLAATGQPGWAQNRPFSLIRDAEIEFTIATYARPVFQSAGISPDSVTIIIVDDPSLNAFVAGGQNLFLHTGLLVAVTDATELIGVIAHESGHIAGGHLARGALALEEARNQALIGTILGLAAAVAAGEPGLAGATIGGTQSMAQRGFLSFTRSMENAADQAALTYLDRASISSRGLLTFLSTLADQELIPESRQVEYIRTHPLTRDRVDAVRAHVAQSPNADRQLPEPLREMFRRMQAKLLGFMHPRRALQRYGEEDPSIAGQYGRAIAFYRLGDLEAALSLTDRLIAEEPGNPFFKELKGQMLMENGRLSEAQPYYEEANQLYPGEPLLLIPLAQIRIESGEEAALGAAISDLNEAVSAGGGSPMAWRLLATAYGRTGDVGMAAVALAEEAMALGDPQRALEQADRAERSLDRGSSGWLQIQDLRRQAEARLR